MSNDSNKDHPDLRYDDVEIPSNDAPVHPLLKFNYILWIVVGLAVGVLYWNGSWGWLDRGYWQDLQRAAYTTFPFPETKDTVEN